MFSNHIHIKPRSYQLSSVISVDEFRATTEKGTYAFNIVNPITGKVIDIVEDRKASSLRSYFLRFPFSERKKVKIIVMDLSNAFRCIIKSLFTNADIITDRFHYVRLFGDGLARCRIDTCASLTNTRLAKSIKWSESKRGHIFLMRTPLLFLSLFYLCTHHFILYWCLIP